MRVATEIGEKRVAHSQSKEQDGMVPLKVHNDQFISTLSSEIFTLNTQLFLSKETQIL